MGIANRCTDYIVVQESRYYTHVAHAAVTKILLHARITLWHAAVKKNITVAATATTTALPLTSVDGTSKCTLLAKRPWPPQAQG